jgi:hypothetical protein
MRRSEYRTLNGILVMALGAAPVGVHAQARVPTHTVICLTPKPLTKGCSDFVFYDGVAVLGVARGAHDFEFGRTRDDLPSYAGGMIGYMRNVNPSVAVGGSVEVGAGLAGRASAKMHYRRWMPRGGSLDMGAGPLWVDVFQPGNGGDVRVRASGVTLDASAIEAHGVGLLAGVDHTRGGGRSSTGLHAGTRLEAWPAVGATLLVGLAFLLTYNSVASHY